jgi:hypothetical protein
LTPFVSLFFFLPSFIQASKPTAPTTTVTNAFKEGASPGLTTEITKQHRPKTSTNENGAVDEDAIALVKVAAEHSGGENPFEMIKMSTKEEKVLVIVLIKDDDDKCRLRISTNENDALGVSPFSVSDTADGGGGTNAVGGINMTVNDEATIALVEIEKETNDCTDCGAISCPEISVDSRGDAADQFSGGSNGDSTCARRCSVLSRHDLLKGTKNKETSRSTHFSTRNRFAISHVSASGTSNLEGNASFDKSVATNIGPWLMVAALLVAIVIGGGPLVNAGKISLNLIVVVV